MKKLFLKLNKLTNLNFTPTTQNDIPKIKSNIPSFKMEEQIPISKVNQEYENARNLIEKHKIQFKGEEEITQKDRKKKRAFKKRLYKKHLKTKLEKMRQIHGNLSLKSIKTRIKTKKIESKIKVKKSDFIEKMQVEISRGLFMKAIRISKKKI